MKGQIRLVPAAALGLLLSLALAGCGSSGSPPTPGAPSATALPTSAGPTATAAPSATAAPTAAVTATPTAAATDAEPAAPAVGSLAVEGSPGVPGRQGSWCYDGACLDGPPGPKQMLSLIETAAGAPFAFSIPESHPFNEWSVAYRSRIDDQPTLLASGGAPYDPDLASATLGPLMTDFTFDGPPSGDWIVTASLQFAGHGSSVYYWHVVAPT